MRFWRLKKTADQNNEKNLQSITSVKIAPKKDQNIKLKIEKWKVRQLFFNYNKSTTIILFIEYKLQILTKIFIIKHLINTDQIEIVYYCTFFVDNSETSILIHILFEIRNIKTKLKRKRKNLYKRKWKGNVCNKKSNKLFMLVSVIKLIT